MTLWLRITAWGLLDRMVHANRLTERLWCDGTICERYDYAIEDVADYARDGGGHR